MTTKTTLASFLALTILGLGISQMAFAEEIITLDPTSNEGASCLAKMQEDTQQKHESSKLHIQKAIAAARSSDSLITEVKNDQYKYEAVTQGWNMDPVTCTVGLIETGVHFRATDSEGKTREIVVKIDPKTDRPVDVKVIHDKDRPTHAGTISTTNFAGHAIRGAASEASSQVYQAYMSYLVPTPNDPAGSWVYKSGARTAVTLGQITVNPTGSGQVTLVSIYIGSGDIGSPVFTLSGDNANIYGMFIGATTGTPSLQEAYYQPQNFIESELGITTSTS